MLRLINNIIPKTDHRVIFSRLGYKQKETELDETLRKEIIGWIDEAASFIKLKAVVLECNFKIVENGRILIEPIFQQADKGKLLGVTGGWDANVSAASSEDLVSGTTAGHTGMTGRGIEIISNSFCKFISEAKRILLMGITCGKEIMDCIEKEQKENMTKAVVLDAAAGEIADSGLDYIVSFYNKELIRKSEKLFTKRFSPGYADLSLETQKVFYDLLEMKKIGVNITESFILIPQKSIIALTGIV